MRYFTADEARNLAKNVIKIMHEDAMLLVTNGPRTGKFDPTSGIESLSYHHSDVIDPTTIAFLEVLKTENVKFQFASFVHGKPSAFIACLADLQKNKSELFERCKKLGSRQPVWPRGYRPQRYTHKNASR